MPAEFIVVVDDDAAVRDSLGMLLEAHGLRVRDFGSGVEFLESDAHCTAACLVLDYHMPEMTGIEILEELQRLGLSYPSILITGLSDPMITRRALSAGVMAILEKPLPDDVLIDAVRIALNTVRPPLLS
ncbi:MAG: fixJ [Rhodospirillales bacterium]|nr:fixJ [Rhodospirillales bacterium]